MAGSSFFEKRETIQTTGGRALSLQDNETGSGVEQWLTLIPSYISAITLFVLMVMTFADVVLRSTINSPIEQATELTRLFMAIIVFSSLPVVAFRGSLIVVDLLDSFTPKVLTRWRDAFVNIGCGILLWWPAKRVWELAERAQSYGDVTEYLRLPQAYIAYFIACATFITALCLLTRGVLFIVAPHKIKTQGEVS